MLWSRKTKPAPETAAVSEQCRQEAEALYRSGRYHCAEAVLAVIRTHFRPELPEGIVQSVTGFGGGSGSGCICGAVSGGTVALGLLFNDKKRVSHMTRELHAWFKERYGVTCCKTIRSTHKGACPVLTGEVAGKIAEMVSGQVL